MSIVIGIVGAIGSALALVDFILKVSQNALDIPDVATPQAFYQSVGDAYGGGFIAGFALCFFLMLLAVAIGTWYESRRSAVPLATESVPMPVVKPSSRG